MFNCFTRGVLDCFQGPSVTITSSYSQLIENKSFVKLDSKNMGSEVVLLKNGTRVCGNGGVIATVPIEQNKAYFEVKIQQSGVWGIGLANKSANLNEIPLTDNCWFLKNDGSLWSNGKLVSKENILLEEGDTIGVTFDHVDLKFYRNSNLITDTITSVRGQVFPLLFVDSGAILDVRFKSFQISPPSGYEEIMVEQTLL
uniref:SPRY domain-containing protein 7 n=1 Tax=Parastrongyloides trichosuri TaxID=131310 RepID=A0A0N4ZRU1_PARTI